jgi:hypothetical protein
MLRVPVWCEDAWRVFPSRGTVFDCAARDESPLIRPVVDPTEKVRVRERDPDFQSRSSREALEQERATGLEPATSSLGRRPVYRRRHRSTTVLAGTTRRRPRCRTVDPV